MAKHDRIANLIINSTDTVKELFLLYAAIILAATMAFQFFESMPMMDALWMTMVTATTTGYGDMFPKTTGGRVTAVLLMHAAVFFVMPLVTARLAAKLIVNSDAFTHDEQELMKHTLLEMREYMIERKTEPGL